MWNALGPPCGTREREVGPLWDVERLVRSGTLERRERGFAGVRLGWNLQWCDISIDPKALMHEKDKGLCSINLVFCYKYRNNNLQMKNNKDESFIISYNTVC